MEKCKATAKIWLTKDELDKINSLNLRIPQLQKDLKSLNLLKSKAYKVIDELGDNHYCGKTPKGVVDKQDVYQVFDRYVKILTNEKRIGTRETYMRASESLQKFAPKLCFKDVTVKFLERYDQGYIGDLPDE